MISEIAISGFQSLDNVILPLGSFTVVVGPSNSGKSAIRRAVQALVENAPATGHLRHGETEIGTSIRFESCAVERAKGGKVNSYFVSTPEGTTEIAKPGQKAPPSATELLRLHPINFVGQFDQPYLLAETPSEAAKALGELTNIAVLFEAIREATRRKREREATSKTLTEQALKVSEQLTGFAGLPDEQANLSTAHASLEAAGAAERSAAWLRAGVSSTEALEAQRAQAWQIISTSQGFEDIAGMVEAAEALLAEAKGFGEVAWRAGQLEQEKEGARIILVPTGFTEPDLSQLQEATTQAEALHRLTQAVDAIMAKQVVAYKDMEVLLGEMESIRAELATIDTCPLCGQPTHQGVLTS